MISPWPVARRVGLGLMAGAVLQGEARAQDTTRVRRDTTIRMPIPPQADTIVRRDSIAQRDSAVRARLARLAADSLKTPLARASVPELVDVARPVMQWDREALFATGALTLLDLLERIPGLTALRAGWMGAPAVGAYLGDAARIRVFYDGLEIDALEPRGGGVLDLGAIQLWTAEEVRVERGADEIRVHIRSWRVQRTTPYTRADVATGDQETNLYRGYFGRRFHRGEALQVAAQQVSTVPARLGGSSNHAAILARAGWARRRWAVDGTILRSSPDRTRIVSSPFLVPTGEARQDTILPVAATETLGFLRAAFGDPEAGPWAQLIAAGQEYRFTGVVAPPSGTPDPDAPVVGADTTRYRGQYVLAAGLTWRGLRLSATERLRTFEGVQHHSPSARASFSSSVLSVSALAEIDGSDEMRAEASLRLAPLSFVALGGAVALRREDTERGVAARAEAAVRVLDVWVGGGLLRRPAASLVAPVIFSTRYVPATEGAATGAFATVRGRLWGAVYADVSATRWADAGAYLRPQYQTRSEVYISTTLPRRFPTGNFGLLASLAHEYRSHTFFATADGVDRAGGYRVVSGLLEIRILQAVVSYQYRNLLVQDYVTVPHYRMPRQSQFYGVRWEFWN